MTDRFTKWFYETNTHNLTEKINRFAQENNLRIISLSANDNLHGAIVLFEGNKPRWL